MCQSHVTATPCNGSIPHGTGGHGSCTVPTHMHWRAGQVRGLDSNPSRFSPCGFVLHSEYALLWQDNSFVNMHSSLCLTDFQKGTLGTRTCDGQPAQQWARQPGGTVTTIQHPGTDRCLTMPPIDSSNAGQIFGRPLANGSFALVFYNPAPAMQTLAPASESQSESATRAVATAGGQSICCDALCWNELSSGMAAVGGDNNVRGRFDIEDVWSGERNGTIVTAGQPFCVEVGAAGENSRTFRLSPVGL
eukprot:COSAG02_NODE_3666_length_6401_cov_133.142812_2_plen_248_part_00